MSSILAQRLRSLRKEKGLTQLEISKMIEISNTTLSQYESNKRMPGFNVLCQLAEIYDSTSDYLLGITNQRTQRPRSSTVTHEEYVLFEKLKESCPALFALLPDIVAMSESQLRALNKVISAFIEGISAK